MKSFAPSTQRTGQPRCRQLMLKAMNSLSLTRRSQAAVFAVMPDQGSGEGSVNSTLIVSPKPKESTVPTLRHWAFAGRSIGAMRKPTTGTPTRAAIAAAQAALTREKNRRRLISSDAHGLPLRVMSTCLSMLLSPALSNLADPQPQPADEEDKASGGHDRRSHNPPENHGDAE